MEVVLFCGLTGLMMCAQSWEQLELRPNRLEKIRNVKLNLTIFKNGNLVASSSHWIESTVLRIFNRYVHTIAI